MNSILLKILLVSLFGSMSKDIAKDMSGALTRVDEKVYVFNPTKVESQPIESQDRYVLYTFKIFDPLLEYRT